MNELTQAIERVRAGHYAPKDILEVCDAAGKINGEVGIYRDLIRHMETHEQYRCCGYMQMPDNLKMLFCLVTNTTDEHNMSRYD